jgi:hypothetical protein
MAFSDKTFRTIKCDGPGCDKTVTFDLTDVVAIQKIDWLKGVRVVATGDQRNLSYCSDVCEVKGVTTGEHNLKEKPKVAVASTGEIKKAVDEAQNAAEVTDALKTGEGAKIQITDN